MCGTGNGILTDTELRNEKTRHVVHIRTRRSNAHAEVGGLRERRKVGCAGFEGFLIRKFTHHLPGTIRRLKTADNRHTKSSSNIRNI